MTYHNHTVYLWASDTNPTGSAGFDAAVVLIRRRGDMPNNFATRAQLRQYLKRCGLNPTNDTVEPLWASYQGYKARRGGDRSAPAGSYREAHRLNVTTFSGPVCPKDPSHGTTKRRANKQCLVCYGLYQEAYKQETKTHRVDINYKAKEVPEPTEEELAIMRAALVKTARRA